MAPMMSLSGLLAARRSRKRLPPHLIISRSVRHDEAVVERWLAARGGVETITTQEDAHA